MESRTKDSYPVKNKGGKLGGEIVEFEYPTFDWEAFKKVPNAEAFVQKAYVAAVKKIARDLKGRTNGTAESDLDTMEYVIARSLYFTKKDIEDWLETRDWGKANGVPDLEKHLPYIRKHLPELAVRINPFQEKYSQDLAYKVVAAVSDIPTGPVAEYLFTMLSHDRRDDVDQLMDLL